MKNIKKTNLNKKLNICIYNVYYINNIDKYNIHYINNKYNKCEFKKILIKIYKIINYNNLNIKKKNKIFKKYFIIWTINKKKSIKNNYIFINKNIEKYKNNNLYNIKIDIEISIFNSTSPLKIIDYIILKFNPDLLFIDYKIKGFNIDINNEKIFIDKKITSIQKYIKKEIKKKYDLFDINIYQENIFFTKMIIKYININKYIFNNKINENKKNKIISLIWKEIKKIYYG